MPEGEGIGLGPRGIAKLASQPLIVDALLTEPDWVIIVCGQFIHHDTLEALTKLRGLLGLRIAAVFTESPYLDEEQQVIAPYCDLICCNDRWSAREHDWQYLPAGYDSSIYYPRNVGEEYKSDVFFAGTGYQERVDLMTQVNWDGIDLVLYGAWEQMDRTLAETPLVNAVRGPLFQEGQYPELAKHTCGAKVAINMHRTSTDFLSGETITYAESMNPRCYEVPACGTFLLTDDARPETQEVFGDTVGYYGDISEFEMALHYYLEHDKEREDMARAAQARAQQHSWNHRAELLEHYLLEAS